MRTDTAEKKVNGANLRRRDAAARRAVPAVRRALERAQRSGMRGVKDETLVVARLRIENPQASLTELAAMVVPASTKDAVAGRLRRFVRDFGAAEEGGSG